MAWPSLFAELVVEKNTNPIDIQHMMGANKPALADGVEKNKRIIFGLRRIFKI